MRFIRWKEDLILPSKTLIILVTVLLMALFAIQSFSTAGEEKVAGETDVVFITVETARADHMPCYGYRRNTTPHLCSVIEDGIKYRNAYTPSSYTQLVLPAIMTGRYPLQVGLYDSGVPTMLREDYTTIGEFLSQRGYRTVFFQKGTKRKPRERNIYQGFDEVRGGMEFRGGKQKYSSYLENQTPIYVRIHLQGVHSPYVPRENYSEPSEYKYLDGALNTSKTDIYDKSPTRMNRSHLIDAYDEDLRSVDTTRVAEILDWLKENDGYRDSIIIVASDHGESFGRKFPFRQKNGGYGHSQLAVLPVLRVPLGVKPTANYSIEEKSTKATVSLIDIFPTIADLIGEGPPEQVTGRNLIAAESRTVFAQMDWLAAIKDRKITVLDPHGREYWSNYNASEEANTFSEAQQEIERLLEERRDPSKLGSTGCVEMKPYFSCD